VLTLLRAEAVKREHAASANRLAKARWLWSGRQHIGFLPARGSHGPAMIAAFGLPHEPEPGQLEIANEAVKGVHLTRLRPDGRGKAGTDADKIMLGHSAGWPLVLAPPNDLLAIAITEGIEDALSVHEATGLGAWAAGSASRLPGLAGAIPTYVEVVTILADGDRDGQRGASDLAGKLRSRGDIDVRVVTPIMRAAA
jgi:hypothetical protein